MELKHLRLLQKYRKDLAFGVSPFHSKQWLRRLHNSVQVGDNQIRLHRGIMWVIRNYLCYQILDTVIYLITALSSIKKWNILASWSPTVHRCRGCHFQILCCLQSSQEVLNERLEILILDISSFSVGERPACHWKTCRHGPLVMPFLQICTIFKLMTVNCFWHTMQ